MANENQNPLVAYAEARIAAWQAVLASVKTALALDAGGQMPDGIELSAVSQNGDLGAPLDLPDGAFHGKSIPACIKLYLSAVKKKRSIKDIATALREGGVESKSGSLDSPVNTALLRLKAAGEVLRFKDGWGLAEWYPANMRGSAPTSAKRSKRKKKGKKATAKGTSAPIPAKAEPHKVTETTKPEDKPEPRILAFFKANRREVAASEVATTLGLKIQTTHLILAKLAHQKKIEKLSPGHFKAVS
jgi:hypothetical protein